MHDQRSTNGDHADTARAIRFLILKAAIFIGVPVIASLLAVLVLLK